VVFSIDDVNAEPYVSDEAYPDESEGSEEAEAEAAEDDYGAMQVKLSIQITKPDKPGALCIDATAQDSRILIEQFRFFKDADAVNPKSFDVELKGRGQYLGPVFQNLDEELQREVEVFVENRGINEELATFVGDYIDWKEQKEYMQWMRSKSLESPEYRLPY
jgi:complement component 1 Q subcomponent-binding protein, mitochondrial